MLFRAGIALLCRETWKYEGKQYLRRKAPSGDLAPDEPADDAFRDARAAGRAHVPLSPRGDAVWVEPQRERGLERDERPLAFPQYLPRGFACAGKDGRDGRLPGGRGLGCRSGICVGRRRTVGGVGRSREEQCGAGEPVPHACRKRFAIAL